MSVFTYDPDPPRVSSPWLLPEEPGANMPRKTTPSPGPGMVATGHLSEYSVTKLEAEPQEGPTEYKLHLLLRPRRRYTSMSTAKHVPGSQQSRPEFDRTTRTAAATMSVSNQSRETRLKQLTTQLLWRLQQSSPYHASTSKDLLVPKFPDGGLDPAAPLSLGTLLPGLEESRGALYEIGVADDGTLVGLTKDEMDESIANLRVMAASLGCNIEIQRMVIVGDCEWLEASELVDNPVTTPAQTLKQGRLWVAEALVTPDLGLRREHGAPEVDQKPKSISSPDTLDIPDKRHSTTEQLRVTLTGPTTSGKSTLLGTLSTGALDNGRGKSRLNLLRHQHEVASGVTSSVAQELIGYKDNAIFNFAHGNIESWVDIHDYAESGRLAFVSDSAGHPRYRRTILRGLVGWAPHWTVLCLAPDEGEGGSVGVGTTSSAREVLGMSGASFDLAKAHLDLCLKLGTPLAVVITKLDLATRTCLQKTVSKVYSTITAAGRTPKLLPPDQKSHPDLTHVPVDDTAKVKTYLNSISGVGDVTRHVPIILTSAVKGTGIGMMHALLEQLPVPTLPTASDFIGAALNPEQPACLFHIDDTFSLSNSYTKPAGKPGQVADSGTVLSGYLRFGRLSVGDHVVIGPFPSEEDYPRGFNVDDRPSPGSYGLSISHPSSAELARIALRNAVPASNIKGEWHNAKIVSIRNLRLPILTLEAGQVGTIGVVMDSPGDPPDSFLGAHLTPSSRVRRGMVMAVPSTHMKQTGLQLQAASGFTALFEDNDAISLTQGSLVNIYIASVRAAARVLHISTQRLVQDPGHTATEDIDDIFNLNEQLDNEEKHADPSTPLCGVEVSLELLTSREWIEMGSRVVVLEGGSKDKSGLEGFVGKVVEIVD
jgi:GTPase